MSRFFDFDSIPEWVEEPNLAERLQKTRRLEVLHNLLVWIFCIGFCFVCFAGVGSVLHHLYLAVRLWVRR